MILPAISGPGIALRQYQLSDVDQLFEAATESVKEVSPWLPWCHEGYTIDESRAWITQCQSSWATEMYEFAIVDSDNRFLGGCGLNQMRRDRRVANLGYWVRTSATHRGVAPTAVKMLAEFAFLQTSLARLEIVVAIGNAASQRVAQKVGAEYECTLRDRLYFYNQPHDAEMYVLLRRPSVSDRLPIR